MRRLRQRVDLLRRLGEHPQGRAGARGGAADRGTMQPLQDGDLDAVRQLPGILDLGDRADAGVLAFDPRNEQDQAVALSRGGDGGPRLLALDGPSRVNPRQIRRMGFRRVQHAIGPQQLALCGRLGAGGQSRGRRLRARVHLARPGDGLDERVAQYAYRLTLGLCQHRRRALARPAEQLVTVTWTAIHRSASPHSPCPGGARADLTAP